MIRWFLELCFYESVVILVKLEPLSSCPYNLAAMCVCYVQEIHLHSTAEWRTDLHTVIVQYFRKWNKQEKCGWKVDLSLKWLSIFLLKCFSVAYDMTFVYLCGYQTIAIFWVVCYPWPVIMLHYSQFYLNDSFYSITWHNPVLHSLSSLFFDLKKKWGEFFLFLCLS